MTPESIRARIMQADDIQKEFVKVPEWGVDFWIWGMDGDQRGAFEAGLNTTKTDVQAENWRQFRAAMLVQCVRDENGARILRDEDVTALNAKSAFVLDRLCDIAKRLSGFTKADVDAITANLPKGQSEGSTSD